MQTNGPISITTINSDTKPGKDDITHLKVTIEIDFSLYGEHPGVNNALLQKYGDAYAKDWDEGRYPFCVEMANNGIQSVMQGAIRSCLIEYNRAIHGNAMKQVDKNTQTSVAVLETEKQANDIRGYIWDTLRVVKVENRDTKLD